MDNLISKTVRLPGLTVIGKIDLSIFDKPEKADQKPVVKTGGKVGKRSDHHNRLNSGFAMIKSFC